MPLKSQAQRRYLWATNPKLAKKFEKETPDSKKLPEKVADHVNDRAAERTDLTDAEVEKMRSLVKSNQSLFRKGSTYSVKVPNRGYFVIGDVGKKRKNHVVKTVLGKDMVPPGLTIQERLLNHREKLASGPIAQALDLYKFAAMNAARRVARMGIDAVTKAKPPIANNANKGVKDFLGSSPIRNAANTFNPNAASPITSAVKAPVAPAVTVPAESGSLANKAIGNIRGGQAVNPTNLTNVPKVQVNNMPTVGARKNPWLQTEQAPIGFVNQTGTTNVSTLTQKGFNTSAANPVKGTKVNTTATVEPATVAKPVTPAPTNQVTAAQSPTTSIPTPTVAPTVPPTVAPTVAPTSAAPNATPIANPQQLNITTAKPVTDEVAKPSLLRRAAVPLAIAGLGTAGVLGAAASEVSPSQSPQQGSLYQKVASRLRSKVASIEYRGKTFPGYNQPIASDKAEKKKMVLAKDGEQVKLIHFGQKGYKHNYSNEAKQNYLKRSAGIVGKNGLTKNDKLSANYWARRELWPKNEPADGTAKDK